MNECKICKHPIVDTDEWVHTFLKFTYAGRQRNAKRQYSKKCWCGCTKPEPKEAEKEK